MRGTGPIGYPGAAEVVNMRPPAYLINEGINALPCIGDGRQSGTSALAVHPQCLAGSGRGRRTRAAAEAATGCASICASGTVNVLVPEAELGRAAPGACKPAGGYRFPASQTPWQEIQRSTGRINWAMAWCSSPR